MIRAVKSHSTPAPVDHQNADNTVPPARREPAGHCRPSLHLLSLHLL